MFTCTRINGSRHLLRPHSEGPKGAFLPLHKHTKQARSAKCVMSITLVGWIFACPQLGVFPFSASSLGNSFVCVSGSKASSAKHPQSDDKRREDKRQNLYEHQVSSSHSAAHTNTLTTAAARCRFSRCAAHGRTPFGGTLAAATPRAKHY